MLTSKIAAWDFSPGDLSPPQWEATTRTWSPAEGQQV